MDSIKIQIPLEYKRLFDRDWSEAAVYGGRNSLKSHTVARFLLLRARQRKEIIGCFREYQNSIADSSHALLKSLIEKYDFTDFKVTDDAIINHETGSRFIFKGLHNNIQSIKSIEGMTYAWVEEAQTVTEASLEILTPTVREEGAQIIYTYNRLRDQDPIHKRLVIEGRPRTLIINVNYDVALKYGWMAQRLIDEMEDDKARRPEVYKHKWLGAPSNKKGLIYPNWKSIPEVPEEAKYLGPGLDFGYTNDPTAIIDVYKWNNGYIVDEVAYEAGLRNFAIANILRRNDGLPEARREDDRIVFEGCTSHLTVGDSSEPKSIDDIAECGVTIMGAVKGKDSVNNGIENLQDREIYYTARSHSIEEEVLNYCWLVNKEDKSLNVPIDAYNHAMDAIRYKITNYENVRPIEYADPVI